MTQDSTWWSRGRCCGSCRRRP